MRKTVRLVLAVGLVAAGLVAAVVTASVAQATVPAGFTDELVASVGSPTAFAFTPDGRMLVTTQPGTVRVVQNGALLATPALTLGSRVCTNSERGLLGVAVDPAFATNRFLFLYYTFNKFSNTCPANSTTSPVNRVSRFVLADTNVIDPASELVLIDNIPSPNGNHNAGDLQFGRDGLLYVSVGDGGCDYAGGGCAGSNDAARDEHVLIGKILRIDRDGGIPAGNPFTGVGTARCNVTGRTTAPNRCQETFAWGLRNPFRMAFDPNAAGTTFQINDVGQNVWEEIDLGAAGADYGWNVREGFCANGSTTNCGTPPAGMSNPIFAYGRSDGCVSITGGAFVPNGIWPAEYQGKYLFADYGCGKIFRLDPAGGGGFNRVDFATGLGGSSAVHMGFGPFLGTQALYYTSYAGGGQVRRIFHNSATNNPPTAVINASTTSGPAPLEVDFSGAGSTDPNGDTLTYEWNFGDGVTENTSLAAVTHTYAAGSYTASLVVRDSNGASSAPDTVAISAGVNSPPVITSVSGPTTFKVGDTITFTATASDPDQVLAAGAFSWEVVQNHAAHTHPWVTNGSGPSVSFPAPAPEDLLAATNSYLTVSLVVTDSSGATDSESRQVQPRKVTLSLGTTPNRLQVLVNNTPYTAPASFTSWEGWVITLEAPAQQGAVTFKKWSDGGARIHTVTTPATARTYKATYAKPARR